MVTFGRCELSNHQIRVHLLKRGLCNLLMVMDFSVVFGMRGMLVGVIGLHEINHMHRKTSIGHYLDKQFEGHGIMTQAVEALIKYCFDEIDSKSNWRSVPQFIMKKSSYS